MNLEGWAVAIAALAFFANAYAVWKQKLSIDLQIHFELLRQFRPLWENTLYAEREEIRDFYFAELLNEIEYACQICNKGFYLPKITKKMLVPYLKQVLRQISAEHVWRERMRELIQDGDTFDEIRNFTNNHKITI